LNKDVGVVGDGVQARRLGDLLVGTIFDSKTRGARKVPTNTKVE